MPSALHRTGRKIDEKEAENNNESFVCMRTSLEKNRGWYKAHDTLS